MSFITSSYQAIQGVLESQDSSPLPDPSITAAAPSKLHSNLLSKGLGDGSTLSHLLTDIVPAFNGSKTSANYYGFVTGGVLPIAEVADNLVTAFDQSVQMHLPEQSVATVVEDRAFRMLLDLVSLEEGKWKGRTFTTGATGSNVLGLACGREAVLSSKDGGSVAEIGILAACRRKGVDDVQVLTSMGHSSLYKASSIVGLGSSNVKDCRVINEPWKLDFGKLEEHLKKERTASIVVVSCGEVNTGRFAADGFEMEKIRSLCDEYGAWLHVDAAFGLFARTLPNQPEFSTLKQGCTGLELADSITGDAHKLLNVPYDCGIFLTRSLPILQKVFENPNAAYLTSPLVSNNGDVIPSPLNIGLENSRRFRALPVYSVLVSHGLAGIQEMFVRQIQLARKVALFLHKHQSYNLLPHAGSEVSEKEMTNKVYMIVLFSAKNDKVNDELVKKINGLRKIYVSGTKWEGRAACRIAVSTWKVDVERDFVRVKDVLEKILL